MESHLPGCPGMSHGLIGATAHAGLWKVNFRMCITHHVWRSNSFLSSVNQNISVSRVWLFIYETLGIANFANTKSMGKSIFVHA